MGIDKILRVLEKYHQSHLYYSSNLWRESDRETERRRNKEIIFSKMQYHYILSSVHSIVIHNGNEVKCQCIKTEACSIKVSGDFLKFYLAI
jgi:hypothetical protein